jgi:hypothetical protein
MRAILPSTVQIDKIEKEKERGGRGRGGEREKERRERERAEQREGKKIGGHRRGKEQRTRGLDYTRGHPHEIEG